MMTESDGQALTDKVVIYAIDQHRLGTSRRVDPEAITTDADKDLIRVGKQIIDCPECDAVKQADREMRRWLREVCIPKSPLKNGTYLLPNTLIERVTQRVRAYKQVRAGLVEAFVAVYPAQVEAARHRLGSLYRESDYVADNMVAGQFYVRSRILSFGVPESLASISQEVYQQVVAWAEEDWREAAEEVRYALRIAYKELVDNLVTRLQPGPDGTKKVIRSSTVERLQEFIELFNDRNVVDDAELRLLVEQARSIISEVDSGDLRKDGTLRGVVLDGFRAISDNLEGMVEDEPVRHIILGD